MLKVKEVSFSAIREQQWTELVRKSRCASFFQTHNWIKLWLAHFEKTLEKTLILAVYAGDVLVGIGPFAIKNHSIAFITLTEINEQQTISDYGDIIALVSQEKIIWEALVSKLIQLTKKHSYTIKLDYLCEHSVSYAILRDMYHDDLEQMEVAPKIPLPRDWLMYLLGLPSHKRHEVKRKMKMCIQEGLQLNRAIINASTLHEYVQLVEGDNQQKNQFFSKAMLGFFIDLLHQPDVELFFLYHKTSVIASLIVFHYKDAFLAYNSSYKLNFSHFSPGLVLFELVIQQAIQSRMLGFDFLRGCERYKYDLGAVDQKLFGLSSLRPLSSLHQGQI